MLHPRLIHIIVIDTMTSLSDGFLSDVPQNHWQYQSSDTLRRQNTRRERVEEGGMNGEKVITILSIIFRRARCLIFCSKGCNHLAGACSSLGPFRPRLVLPHKNQVSALVFISPLLESNKNDNFSGSSRSHT